MLLRGLQRRTTHLHIPLGTVTTSIKRADGFVLLGAVGSVFLLQSIRRAVKSRHKPSVPSSTRSLQVHASLAVEQDSEWVVENKGHSKNVKSTKQIVLLEEVLPLTARELWELIFSHGFQQSFHDRVRDTDCQIGTWHLEGEEVVRRNTYIHPVKKNAVGPSEAFTEENCQCLQRNDDGFVIEIQAFTRQVPYGKSFHVQLEWMASKASKSSTKLVVVGSIVFAKKLLLGGFIQSAAQEGMIKSYQEYKEHLWSHLQLNKSQPASLAETSSQGLRRTDSARAATLAVEDLIKNGVFVSWWSVMWAACLLWFFQLLLRLALLQNGRLLATSF